MARLNTHLSATPQPQPQPSRSSTVDTLYRDPTPQSRLRVSTARGSSYSVMSPAQSASSDKENDEPESRDNTPRLPTKTLGGRRQMAAPRLPTPSSGSSASGHENKRRRTGDYSPAGSSAQIYLDEDAEVDEPEDDDDDVEDEDEDVVDDDAPADDANDDEDETTKFYDPQQDPEKRRMVRLHICNTHRNLEDNRDEFVKPGNDGILHSVQDLGRSLGKVKQTSDAVMEAKALVYASELATKRLDNSLYGNTDVGLDVDQFVSKCIFFMKNGGNTTDENAGSATQARNRRQAATQAEDDDDDDDAGDGLDWAILGREACFPCNRRPAVSSFLLGPLSVQKRARAVTARRGKSQRQPTGPGTRPQELTQADLQQSENSNLTHVVKGIRSRLQQHIETASQELESQLDESATELEVDLACREQRVYQTPGENEAAVSLFDFVVNPKSFGQTVENIFYTSFLIKEGNLRVLHSDEGLPLLVPCEPYTIDQQREQEIQKHQAIFSIDYSTWQKLIQAFDIKEPLIPHRVEEESQVTSGGWYG